jgi:flagellar M-ring protein FliF
MANQVQAIPVEDGERAMIPASASRWLAAQLQQLGIERILALAVVILALIGLLAFIAFKAVEPRYALLYAGMALDDTRTVTSRLEAMGVGYRLSPQGDAVMVPANRVLDLRMALASDGLPGGGVVGYEIFDTADSFGTTEFLSNINLKRAMEGELARTIQSLRSVRTARVHLVQPRRELFRRDQAPASASVFLSVSPGGLGRGEITAVRHLVAAAVPGLDANRITVADDQGRLLARGGDSGDGVTALDDTEGYRTLFESRLQEKILQLLERSLGPGRVEAQVTAELDFDSTTMTEEIYDPDRQVVRSTQIIDETTELDERQRNDRVTVANNLPGGAADGDAATSREQRARSEETVNYEISRIVRNQTRRGGRLERLSVAVQVDGSYRTDAAGELVFEPLPAAELAELEQLVRNAVGLDDARGDTLSIVSRRLAVPEPEAGAPAPLLGLERADWLRLGEMGGLLAVALLILLFGVRPLLRRLSPVPGEAEAAAGPRLLTGPDGKQLLVHDAGGWMVRIDEHGRPVLVGADGEPLPGEAASEPEQRISLKQIEGSVSASMLVEMAELVKTRPEDAIRVIRTWLHQQ